MGWEMGWRSGQAYSSDLRTRVLASVDEGMPVRQAAPVYRVSISWIYKALMRRRRTGHCEPAARLGRPGRRLDAHKAAILTRIAEEPDITLIELQSYVAQAFGLAISVSALWYTLDDWGLTFKKNRSRRRAGSPGRRGGPDALARASAHHAP
jgi:transposase